MALLDSLRALLGQGTRYENVVYTGPTVSEVLGVSAGDLYRTQPHLRTVVSFLARNIAQLPLQGFQRVGDNDRRRVKDDPLVRTLAMPNPTTTGYELLHDLVGSLKVYDVAVWMLTETDATESGWQIWPIPPEWVSSTGGGTAWAPQWIEILRPGSGKRAILENAPGKPMQFLMFHGWNPSNPAGWSSPIESLRQILAEQIQAWQYREQVWQRGGRVGTVLVRPATAPAWSEGARTKFARDWAAKWTGQGGPKAGGTPILEDGMELKRIGFSAHEDEWVEAAKLSLSTVAGVYHTSPTMVGVLDNANFSNVREFSRMLYTDTLGPDLAMIEARINAFLVPLMSKTPNLYLEFNIAEKLQGSFEEQAAVVSTSVGRPWMTADEARARFNMPALGGDAASLVTPLNVLVGGQASPRDSGSQNRSDAPVPVIKDGVTVSRESSDAPVTIKAEAADEDRAAAQRVLVRFFRRQRAAVMSQLGAKADGEWWDEERWNRELADELEALAVEVTSRIGKDTLRRLGIDPDSYSVARTREFLRAVAESRSGAINSTTRDQIEAALGDEVGEDAERSTPSGVFDQAESSRADQASTTLATTLAAIAVVEAGRQAGRPKTTKTWVVTSRRPRPSHAAMGGQTVPIDERFANGMNWPGDPRGGADEVAGCSCVVDVEIP